MLCNRSTLLKKKIKSEIKGPALMTFGWKLSCLLSSEKMVSSFYFITMD